MPPLVRDKSFVFDRTFVPSVLADLDFGRHGAIAGRFGDMSWVALDPTRHLAPLVWEKRSRDYADEAKLLNATVFTNGPMMEFPPALGGGLWSPKRAGLEVAATGALVFLSGLGGSFVRSVALGTFAAGAWYQLWLRMLDAGSRPFGPLHGAGRGVHALGVNGGHYYFARSARRYQIGVDPAPGAQPVAFEEVLGGLIPLVLGGVRRSAIVGTPTHNGQYEGMSRATGIVGWAIVPYALLPGGAVVLRPGSPGEVIVEPGAGPDGLPDDADHPLQPWEVAATETPGGTIDHDFTGPTPGVLDGALIVVAGSDEALWNQILAGRLVGIGASDAVAMDGSKSAMMGSGGEFWVGPPQLLQTWRRSLGRYGFYVP